MRAHPVEIEHADVAVFIGLLTRRAFGLSAERVGRDGIEKSELLIGNIAQRIDRVFFAAARRRKGERRGEQER